MLHHDLMWKTCTYKNMKVSSSRQFIKKSAHTNTHESTVVLNVFFFLFNSSDLLMKHKSTP